MLERMFEYDTLKVQFGRKEFDIFEQLMTVYFENNKTYQMFDKLSSFFNTFNNYRNEVIKA